jgi:hypothetical protein
MKLAVSVAQDQKNIPATKINLCRGNQTDKLGRLNHFQEHNN